MNPREFATQITQQLQSAGHTALFAGGCVRDDLLGRPPKDFDVATSALPEQVRELFGHRRTLAIGAAFGVITIVGPKSAGNIEVATFRRDGGYSDGRRPDSVEFTDAREDAIRRDFTINGMFFDPVARQVIDYVGGQQDLQTGLIRAIGNPHERFDEDKLRMLRAVRFSTTYDFEIEAETLAAIRQKATEIHVVSPERIGVELRKTLTSPNRSHGLQILHQTALLQEILPAARSLPNDSQSWNKVLNQGRFLDSADFATAIAILFGDLLQETNSIFENWRLSNQEKESIDWILKHTPLLVSAHTLAWSKTQRLFLNPNIDRAVEVLKTRLKFYRETKDLESAKELERAIGFCERKLKLTADELNPLPLVTGNDLKASGMTPGKHFSKILTQIRNEQLDERLTSKETAIARALTLADTEMT